MTGFKRGFKTWCEKTASGFRRDLGLDPLAKLCPRALARHLKLRVVYPDDIPGMSPKAINQLTREDCKGWSAVTLLKNNKQLIILNSSSSEPRQISSLMHEVAHIILDHEPARIDVSPNGWMLLDTYDPLQEKEADWLAAALLVPRDALLHFTKLGKSLNQNAEYFGVSLELVRMRQNTTGIFRQVAAVRA